jgi:hypothetical protein
MLGIWILGPIVIRNTEVRLRTHCKLDHSSVMEKIVYTNEEAKLTKRASKCTQGLIGLALDPPCFVGLLCEQFCWPFVHNFGRPCAYNFWGLFVHNFGGLLCTLLVVPCAELL